MKLEGHGGRDRESAVKLEGQIDVINGSLQEAGDRGPRRRGTRGDGERRARDRESPMKLEGESDVINSSLQEAEDRGAWSED